MVNLGGPGVYLNGVSVLIDCISLVFGLAVRFVILNVFIYSGRYIGGESLGKYFFFPLSLFRGRILMLIFRGDVSVLFLAWDGLGIRSFLLVIYYSKRQRASAGLVTILTNRLGDVCLLLGLGFVGFNVFPARRRLVCGLFVVAAFRKSAQ